MMSEIVQILDTYVTKEGVITALLTVAAASIVLLLLVLWARLRTNRIRGYEAVLSKEDRAKGFDMMNIQNPRNFKLLFGAHTPQEKEAARKWREKVEFMLGKPDADDLINQAMNARYQLGRRGISTPSLGADAQQS